MEEGEDEVQVVDIQMSTNCEEQVKSAVEDSKMQAAVSAKKENKTVCVCFEGFDNQEKMRLSELME